MNLRRSDFRAPTPVPAMDGSWIVDGWQAWGVVEGEHRRDCWPAVISACRAFHRALETSPRPAFLDRRDSPFARADRIAWEEEPADCHPRLMPAIDRLLALLRSINLPSQLIHGDLTENVLFVPGLPPAIIDLSPYWRPAAYAQAIVVADALDWCGADESILDYVRDVPEIWQLMVRAELFRIAICDGIHRQGGDVLDVVEGHLGTIARLEQVLG